MGLISPTLRHTLFFKANRCCHLDRPKGHWEETGAWELSLLLSGVPSTCVQEDALAQVPSS